MEDAMNSLVTRDFTSSGTIEVIEELRRHLQPIHQEVERLLALGVSDSFFFDALPLSPCLRLTACWLELEQDEQQTAVVAEQLTDDERQLIELVVAMYCGLLRDSRSCELAPEIIAEAVAEMSSF